MTWRRLVGSLILTALVCTSVPAWGDEVLVELRRFRPEEMQMAGFELEKSQTVSIKAVGIRHGRLRHDVELSAAWILDARTRDLVWHIEDARSEDDSDHLRQYSDEVRLDAGRYEVYYSAWPSYKGWWDSAGNWFRDLVRDIFDDDFDYRDYKRAAKRFEIIVRGDGSPLDEEEMRQAHRQLTRDAIVSYRGLEDDFYEEIGLRVDRPTRLKIYAVGEANKEGSYDYGWMINTETREVVWRMEYRDSDHAGGAKKNRVVSRVVSVPAGSYALFVATDDSHHFGDWNAPPPYDPFFWGVTVTTEDAAARSYVKLEDYRKAEEKNVVLRFAPLRDEVFETQGFTLKKPTKLRVYAVGEGVKSEMVDYSWIMNADTRETVWEFTYRESDHAGGAAKNRMINTTVELPKGNYVAYAITDGSHSHRRWNASAPHDQEHWGLTIYAPGGTGDISRYEEQADKNVLAQIIRVGDNDYERERFQVDERTRVHVYAIGEGNDGRMYDYAWIESEDTDRIVWEMSYRMTRHAGGAKKNRLYDDIITLDPGRYTLYYESDGSHSFNHWNAKPPRDLWSWGVTLRLAKGR